MAREQNTRTPRNSLLCTVFVVPALAVKEEDGEIHDVEIGDWGVKAGGERPC